MVSLPALGREMGQATSPAARLVTDSIPPGTAEWWRLRRSNRNSGKHSATLSVWSPNFATMRKIPRRRKLVLPQSLRLRQQTSGVRVSPAKIVAAPSLRVSVRPLRTRTTWLAACSTTRSRIPRAPPCRRCRCRSIRAFAQPPRPRSPRRHWAPITRPIWPDGPRRIAIASSALGQTQSSQRCPLHDRSFPPKGTRVSPARSPDSDGDRQCEWGDHKSEVDPGPISLGILGEHEKMDNDPQANRKSQRKPDEIAGGLVNRRKGFALGAAHAYGHGHERPDEQRTKSHGHYSEPHRDGRCRRPDLGWTELLRFGAHGLTLADPPFPARGVMYVSSVAPSATPRAQNRDKFSALPGGARHRAAA